MALMLDLALRVVHVRWSRENCSAHDMQPFLRQVPVCTRRHDVRVGTAGRKSGACVGWSKERAVAQDTRHYWQEEWCMCSLV